MAVVVEEGSELDRNTQVEFRDTELTNRSSGRLERIESVRLSKPFLESVDDNIF